MYSTHKMCVYEYECDGKWEKSGGMGTPIQYYCQTASSITRIYVLYELTERHGKNNAEIGSKNENRKMNQRKNGKNKKSKRRKNKTSRMRFTKQQQNEEEKENLKKKQKMRK